MTPAKLRKQYIQQLAAAKYRSKSSRKKSVQKAFFWKNSLSRLCNRFLPKLIV